MTVSDILPPGLRTISAQLTRARAQARALPGPPSGMPDSLEDAYRIQDASISSWDDRIAGWKVGGVGAKFVDHFGADRLVGPIFAKSVRHVSSDGPTSMPVFDGGFAAIEPEFIFQLGQTRDEDRLFVGAEIASSPIPDINDYGPVAVISDFGNNNGLLLGPEISNWRSRDPSMQVTTIIDGQVVGQSDLADFASDGQKALAFLVMLSEKRGYDLPVGTYVSSGAITGVHEAPVGARSSLQFGDVGVVELELVSAVPQ